MLTSRHNLVRVQPERIYGDIAHRDCQYSRRRLGDRGVTGVNNRPVVSMRFSEASIEQAGHMGPIKQFKHQFIVSLQILRLRLTRNLLD